MPRHLLRPLATLTLCLATTLGAQSPATSASDSVARAVQRFNGWYLPSAARPGTHDVMMLAATHGPLPFDAALVHWPRVDSTARAHAKA